MARMFGCDSAATAFASRSNRSRASAIRGEVGGQDLDRDVTIQLRIARSEDFSHATGAERCDDPVGPEKAVGFERHA